VLTGKHHGESEKSQELGIKIVSFLRDKVDGYKKAYRLNFTCYATPAEGLSNKFTLSDEKKFGKIS
jgi:ribonucleoside-triphosphate reductase